LPAEYAPWLIDEPDAATFADLTLALLEDDDARRALAAAGAETAAGLSGRRYVRETVALIRERAVEKREIEPLRLD
ncbi:MAG: hypothetical protein JXB36_01690, partial [Gammaproteobacteria bacterium]|nr:hypothetical protein [Gammaproteobacteria bacterium]